LNLSSITRLLACYPHSDQCPCALHDGLSSKLLQYPCSLLPCAICVAIPPQAPAVQALPHLETRNDVCGFPGNSDLYGLGIRLGVYFQWASALIIYGWYPEGQDDLAESYLVFLFALTVGIIVITARAVPTYAAEILLLTYIIFGRVWTVMFIGVRERHRKRVQRSSTHVAQGVVLFVTLAAVSIYCSWFWIHGLHHNVLATPCGTYGFLFTKVSLYNPSVYKFFAALSTYLAVGYGGITLLMLGLSTLFFLRVPVAVRQVGAMFPNSRSPWDITEAAAAEIRKATSSSKGRPPEQTNAGSRLEELEGNSA
jgi:hypothetical protein